MTNKEYQERKTAALVRYALRINHPDYDNKQTGKEVDQAIDQLVLDVIGEDETKSNPKDHEFDVYIRPSKNELRQAQRAIVTGKDNA